jgi:tetratricopeptide (TPR) repeat protein
MKSDEKISEVTHQLTGDLLSDRKLLEKAIISEKQNPQDAVYLSGLLSLYYFSSDFDNIDQFISFLLNDDLGADNLTIALKALENSGQLDRAAFLATHGIHAFEESIDKSDLFPPVAGTDYRNFNNRIEEILYLNDNNENHQLIRPKMNYSNLYQRFANIILKQDDAKQAEIATKKALEWNPYNVDAWLTGAEASLELCDLAGFLDKTKKALSFCYKPNRLAQCYNNFGRYYEKMQLLDVALACYSYAFSLQQVDDYRESLDRMMKLLNIAQMPSAKSIIATLNKYNIPLNTSQSVVRAAYLLGKIYYERKNYENALKYLSIAYSLADLPEVKALIDEITSYLN